MNAGKWWISTLGSLVLLQIFWEVATKFEMGSRDSKVVIREKGRVGCCKSVISMFNFERVGMIKEWWWPIAKVRVMEF